MGRRWFAVVVVLAAVAVVVPVWGAPSNYSVPPMRGGDTMSVSCEGVRIDRVVVDAVNQTLTCVADESVPTTTAAPTTTATTTTSTTTTSTSTTTTLAPTTTAPTGGVYSDGFANLNNWTFAHFMFENMVVASDPRTTATIVNGRAQINAFDQNYGDATLRSAVRYDLTNGGTVTLDMTDDSAGNPLVGFANVSFSANPDDGKASMAAERDLAYYPAALPADALQIQLRDNCRVPWAPPTVVRYRSDLPNGRTVQTGWCGAAPDGRWRLVFTTGRLSIRNGAGAEVVAYNVTVPPTGWVILGVHNHASVKYSGAASVVGLFDNISYPNGG